MASAESARKEKREESSFWLFKQLVRPMITLRLTHFMFVETNDINKKIKLLHLKKEERDGEKYMYIDVVCTHMSGVHFYYASSLGAREK
jgi:hypothetical protein